MSQDGNEERLHFDDVQFVLVTVEMPYNIVAAVP